MGKHIKKLIAGLLMGLLVIFAFGCGDAATSEDVDPGPGIEETENEDS